MSKVVLGDGAVCCGDPTDCNVQCGQKDLLFDEPALVWSAPAPVADLADDDEQEEDDE